MKHFIFGIMVAVVVFVGYEFVTGGVDIQASFQISYDSTHAAIAEITDIVACR